MRLQGKLLLIFLFLSIVPLSISSVFMVGTLNQEVSQRIEDVHTEELGVLAARMDWSLEQSSRGVRQVIESFDLSTLSNDEVTGLLRLLYRQMPQVNTVALLDADGARLGEVVHLTDQPRPGSDLAGHFAVSADEVEILFDPSFIERARGRIATWGEPVSLSGSPFPHFPLAISSAERAGGRGALVLALVSVAELSDQMGRFAQEMGRPVALVARDRRTLLRTGPGGVRVVSDQAPDDEKFVQLPPELWSTLSGGQSEISLRYRDEDGVEQLGVYGKLESVDLRLVAVMPAAEAFGAVHSIRSEIGYWLGVSVLIAIIFAVFFARSLTGPITALSEAVRGVGDGHYQQAVAIQTRDEIGELSEAFNEMVRRLQAQRDEIERQSDEIRGWNVDLQRRVEERTRELKEAQDYLIHTQKLAAVAEISSGVAHELNNPLAVVLGFVQILKDKHKADGDKDGPLLARIEEQAQRCRDIVTHLLSFSQASVDQGGQDRVDFSEVVRTVLKLFGAYFVSRKVELKDELPSPLNVFGNRGQLMQAILQLVSAVRSTIPQGGVLLLQAVDGPDKVVVRLLGSLEGLGGVDTSGSLSGFNTEDRDQALSQGLGLWLSQKIVQEHGGHIDIENTRGATSIVVTLPKDEQGRTRGAKGAA